MPHRDSCGPPTNHGCEGPPTPDGADEAPPDQEDEDEATPGGEDDPDANTLAARRDRAVRPALNGEIGLLHVTTLDTGPANSFRVGLHAEYFSASDFLVDGDDHTHIGATLGVGYTPIRDVEAYLAFARAEPDRFRIVDGSGSVADSDEAIRAAVAEALPLPSSDR